LRGWDAATGRPTAGKLSELGLADVAAELTRLGLIPENQQVVDAERLAASTAG
jgi:hypothetical protein